MIPQCACYFARHWSHTRERISYIYRRVQDVSSPNPKYIDAQNNLRTIHIQLLPPSKTSALQAILH